jgi:hypothetical protein
MIQSYDLNFHPVLHSIKVSYEHYTSIMNVKKARGADGGDVSRFMSKHAQDITLTSL